MDPNYDKMIVQMNRLNDYIKSEQKWRDFHAVSTIHFGNLIDSGWDWGRNEWPAFNDEVRERVNKKIEDRYFFREICEVPPARFKLFLLRKLREIAPKYNIIYKVIDDERLDILETGQYYDKGRNVFSEYPQSQIQGESDYATNADDKELKGKRTGSITDLLVDFENRYNDTDVLLINHLEVCFLSMTTLNMNGF